MRDCASPDYAGMHVLGEDTAVVTQLVNPETKAPVAADGAIGERVKTSLRWQAQPQLRASVGDVYELLTAPCACGLPGPRVRVIGRTDDLLIVKGVKVYPAAIRNLVQELAPLATGELRVVLSAPAPGSSRRCGSRSSAAPRPARPTATAWPTRSPTACTSHGRPPRGHGRRGRVPRAHGVEDQPHRAALLMSPHVPGAGPNARSRALPSERVRV